MQTVQFGMRDSLEESARVMISLQQLALGTDAPWASILLLSSCFLPFCCFPLTRQLLCFFAGVLIPAKNTLVFF